MTLRLLADENIPASLIRRLQELDEVEVDSVAEDAPGIDDVEVLRRAVESGAVVLTADHDFGELVVARGLEAAGVVLLRVHPIRAHLDGIVSAIPRACGRTRRLLRRHHVRPGADSQSPRSRSPRRIVMRCDWTATAALCLLWGAGCSSPCEDELVDDPSEFHD